MKGEDGKRMADEALEDADGSGHDSGRITVDFFRSLRHDLRTPINHILGYSELLLEEASDEGQGRFIPDLEKIHVAGKQLLALVSDFLDSSKLAEGNFDVDQMSQELRTPLNSIIGYSQLLREDAEEVGQAELVPDLEKIHVAGRQLLEIVNAIVELRKIQSTGVEQVAAERVRSLSGRRPDAARPPLVSARAASRTTEGSLLVVDDSEANRDMLARRLERLGYRVSVAENGRVALERIRSEPFDLLLLDIVMPEMDGYQVLQQLKADEALHYLPVIVLSAIDETDSAVSCIELGAEDYLSKPFDPVLLQARISACLEKKRLRDQEALYLRQIEEEKRRSDELLHIILPHEIAEELKATNEVKPRRHEDVAVLFCDIVGFTGYCDRRQPHEVIPHLQRLVESYEDIALRHDLQKIKTIGDSFMAACGLLKAVDNPVFQCVQCGVEMIATARSLPTGWDVRVGIHIGPVVAGVLGQRQYLFDLFGDTVNTAARVESHGITGSITLSDAAWRQISDRCRAESLGLIEVKGKGPLEMFRFQGFIAPESVVQGTLG